MALAINAIATNTSPTTYTQGPAVACSTCTVCNQGAVAINVGLSSSPGNNVVIVPPNGGQFLFVVSNANLLYVANVSGSSAQEVSFLTQ